MISLVSANISIRTFIEDEITGSLLSELDEKILETELGVKSRIHRIKLMQIIDDDNQLMKCLNLTSGRLFYTQHVACLQK